MIPVLIYLALNLIGLGIAIANHGKPKKGNENFWVTFFAALLAWILLYYGGFFNPLLEKL